MKPTNVLMISGLLALFAVSGCARTEYVEVRPQCTPPSQPALPFIDQGELWDALGDAQYRQLERYINGLWGWADEQGAMLEQLCGTGPASSAGLR